MRTSGEQAYRTKYMDLSCQVPVCPPLGIESGDRVLFVVEGDSVRMMNAAVYAMKVLQQQMEGSAEASGLIDEEAILSATRDARKEVANE